MKIPCINCGRETERVKCKIARCFECTKNRKNEVAKLFQANAKKLEKERHQAKVKEKKEAIIRNKTALKAKEKLEQAEFRDNHIPISKFITYSNRQMYIKKTSFLRLLKEAGVKWSI